MNQYQYSSGYQYNFQPSQQQSFGPLSSTSPRASRPRFGFNAAPLPYPRPRSSASKPNPNYQETQYDNNTYGQDMNLPYNYSSPNDSSYNNTYPIQSGDQNSYDDSSYNNPPNNNNGFRGEIALTGGNSQLLSSFDSLGNMPNANYKYEKDELSQNYFSKSLGSTARKNKNYSLGHSSFTGNQTYPSPKAIMEALTAGKTTYPNKRGQKRKAPSVPQIPRRCDTCNLDFTSQIPLDMHLRGSRHMKKLKALDTLKCLQLQGHAKANDTDTQSFKCEFCDLVLNGALQLQMHFEGTKHKNKVRDKTTPQADNQENGKEVVVAAPLIASAPPPPPPAPVDNSDGAKPAKFGKFSCELCNVIMNSEIQLQQHLASKKHEAKVEGKPLPKKKGKKKKEDESGDAINTEDSEMKDVDKQFNIGIIPLTSSFVRKDMLN